MASSRPICAGVDSMALEFRILCWSCIFRPWTDFPRLESSPNRHDDLSGACGTRADKLRWSFKFSLAAPNFHADRLKGWIFYEQAGNSIGEYESFSHHESTCDLSPQSSGLSQFLRDYLVRGGKIMARHGWRIWKRNIDESDICTETMKRFLQNSVVIWRLKAARCAGHRFPHRCNQTLSIWIHKTRARMAIYKSVPWNDSIFLIPRLFRLGQGICQSLNLIASLFFEKVPTLRPAKSLVKWVKSIG